MCDYMRQHDFDVFSQKKTYDGIRDLVLTYRKYAYRPTLQVECALQVFFFQSHSSTHIDTFGHLPSLPVLTGIHAYGWSKVGTQSHSHSALLMIVIL